MMPKNLIVLSFMGLTVYFEIRPDFNVTLMSPYNNKKGRFYLPNSAAEIDSFIVFTKYSIEIFAFFTLFLCHFKFYV